MDQVFASIISNAFKYSDLKRALEFTVDAIKTHNKVVYTIRDMGKGIGLSLVKRIIEKHKGKVWAESEKNKGSVFHIELHDRSFTEF